MKNESFDKIQKYLMIYKIKFPIVQSLLQKNTDFMITGYGQNFFCIMFGDVFESGTM